MTVPDTCHAMQLSIGIKRVRIVYMSYLISWHMQSEIWQDPVVKWKQELIRRDVEMDLMPGCVPMAAERVLADFDAGRTNKKFAEPCDSFLTSLRTVLRDAKDATLECADTKLVSAAHAQAITRAFITCTSNLLVPPDEVLEHFECVGDDAMFTRHVWMELLFTMNGNTLLDEFGKNLEIDENVGPDAIVIECLRKGETTECLSICLPLIKDAIMITDEHREKVRAVLTRPRMIRS